MQKQKLISYKRSSELEQQADKLLAQAGCFAVTTHSIYKNDRNYRLNNDQLRDIHNNTISYQQDLSKHLLINELVELAEFAGCTPTEIEIVVKQQCDYTQKEIAKEYNFCQQNISKILDKIWLKIGSKCELYPYWGLREILLKLFGNCAKSSSKMSTPTAYNIEEL